MTSSLMFDIAGSRFIDAQGRHAILRGVNLGGDSKTPWPDGGTDRPSDFSDHRTVSFIGRPFPLDQADEHLGRLRSWGFNVLRLLTTWEAVEHAGHRQYDQAYLDYFEAVCRKAADHGLAVFIDFHQDVWSRMSGGDGAPGWVFEAVGLDFARFDAAGAAHVMQHRYDYSRKDARQEDRYPMMSWPSNYALAANGIMWSAFFAGRTLTPDWMVDGRNVQDFLQDAYLGAVAAVAERLKTLSNVLGFDSLNEPGLGWVGQKTSERRLAPTTDNPAPVWPGPAWTPLDGLKAAAGLTASVPVLGRGEDRALTVVGERILNPQGVSIWRDEGPDPFERAGAWRRDDDGGAVLDEDFFRVRDGRILDHERDFMQPFFHRVAETIRTVRADWLLFGELCPYILMQGRTFPGDMPARTVNASHWYDIDLLRSKAFDPDAPLGGVKMRYEFQLGYIQTMANDLAEGGAPTLIGEFGVPYDLNHGEAFDRWHGGERGDDVWRAHAAALGLMYDVMDGLLLSSTQWNYTASNRNDLRVGDGWNQEDLSIFSVDQHRSENDPASGARGFQGFCRPYAQRTQGVLRSMGLEGDVFEMSFDADAGIDAPTEIFAPASRYPNGLDVVVLEGDARWSIPGADQILKVHALTGGPIRLRVSPR